MGDMGLTEQEQRFLDAVASFTEAMGYPPTTSELMELLGWSSPGSVTQVKAQLRDKGRLTWLDGQPRTIKVVDNG